MWDCADRTFIKLTFEPLSVEETSGLVSSPEAGATSVFVGTTRNNFDGKAVTKLEYEGYQPMAEKCMRVSELSICCSRYTGGRTLDRTTHGFAGHLQASI